MSGHISLEPGDVVGGRYRVVKQLGEGGYGKVYHVCTLGDPVQVPLALKVERKHRSTLGREWVVLRKLEDLDVSPAPHRFWRVGNHYALTMDLKGPDLRRVLREDGGCLSVGHVSGLMVQMLDHLSQLHRIGFIHRDLKPHNFVLEHPSLVDPDHLYPKIYLIDFGLSSMYVDSDGVHLPRATGVGYRGTFKYLSIRNHRGIQPSRRDDLESLAYTALMLLEGRLPWDCIKDKNHGRAIRFKS